MRVPDAVQREASSRSGAPLIRDRTDWNGPGSAAHHSAALHAALRPGHESAATTAASCEEPTFTCGRIRSIVSGLLFTMKTATRTCEPSARDIVRARDLHAIFELDDVRARDLLDNGPLERMGPPAMGPAHGPATN